MTPQACWCRKHDHPQARALWASQRPARLNIVCPRRHHRLAAVYDVLAHGGLLLLQPGFKGLMDHYELADVQHGHAAKLHQHATLRPLADLPALVQVGRCRCGTRSYSRRMIEDGLADPWGRGKGGVPFIYANVTANNRTRHATGP